MSETAAEAPVFDWGSKVYDESTLAETAYGRILVGGLPKIGKTTAVVTTAPGPVLVINADGDSALKYPRKLGAKLKGIDVNSRRSLKEAVELAHKAAKAGAVGTVVLDSVSLLADAMLREMQVTLDGFELYGELADHLGNAIVRLRDLPCHLFVIAHLIPGHEKDGILPMIPGVMKHKIIALLHDTCRFEYNPEANPQRRFIVGPNKDWSYAGRNVKRTVAIEATVPALFNELGIVA